jgi:hypothetical protein
MPDATPTVLLVGHCSPDAFALRSAVGSAVPRAAIVFANDQETLAKHAPGARLLLINRVLDGDFDAQDGVALIRELGPAAPAMMLISNVPEAQSEAAAAGALPGFGKRDMYADTTREKLRAALGVPKP